MAHSIEVSLSGNLGERHRNLNGLVLDAYRRNVPLHAVPETSALKRLLKIDLASKQRNVDYILHSLKDDDMLYVSRALKSLWLLEPEYSNIINPSFLEHELFTHMRLQAVNKMRHWIQMHLRDPMRCSEFYQFYKDRDFNMAVKFLWHCSNEYILSEIVNILDKITPKHLKLLSEKVPKVTQIYFENLKQNQTVLKYYLDNDLKFFANVKFLLKVDPNVFFYVLENFFVFEKFSSFSSEMTKFILRHHKNRFVAKPELYTVWFLDMITLSNCLSSKEVKDLVMKLAKAEFLGSWFSYKNVEPLVNRLNKEERTDFKKLIFVDKAFGPTVKEWSYTIPVPPKLKVHPRVLFEDRVIKPPEYITGQNCSAMGRFGKYQTQLDRLFDQYRFTSFQQTFIELRKRLRAESNPQSRQYMLLVLVSKTGGRAEDMAKLIDLLSHYKNEPVQIRSAIFRSLVKRAFVWRLTPEQWAKLLKWGHGLGLDGVQSQPETNIINSKKKESTFGKKISGKSHFVQSSAPDAVVCNEGLHAVILRDLLTDATPSEVVWGAFMNTFSPLAEYSLSVDERNCISSRLPTRLLADAQSNPEVARNRLHYLLDSLSAYHIRFDEFPGTVEAILATAKNDFESSKSLLTRLYKAGVGRKKLMNKYFEMMQTDDSYVNALKHDISILERTEKFEELLGKKALKHERFLRKLALYFMEKDGLGERYQAKLELQAATTPNKMLARPLAWLAGAYFLPLLETFSSAAPKTPERQLSAALRSNAHIVRPPFDLESFGFKNAGAKAVSNQLATCRQTDVERYLAETLSWSRTLRLALILAKRANKEHEAYQHFALKRPGAALKAALRYFKVEGNELDLRIWKTVKPLIAKYDLRRPCHYSITNIESVPAVIKAEYCVLVYRAYEMSSKETALSILYKMPAILHEIDDQFNFEITEAYLRDECTAKMILSRSYHERSCSYLYVTIIGKFLLLSTSKEMFEERFQRVGIPFFKCIESLWKRFQNTESIRSVESDLWVPFMWSLTYKKVFFDTKYELCLTVFERILDWMHSFLPIDKWFDVYVEVHLTMVYYKTARCCLKQDMEMYSDEGVYMLGNIFGKLIANEVEDLRIKYFPSVIRFYVEALYIFLVRYYFQCRKSDEARTIDDFTKAMLKGLLSAKESEAAITLAIDIIKKTKRKDDKDLMDDIIRSYQESEKKELRFCVLVDAVKYY